MHATVCSVKLFEYVKNLSNDNLSILTLLNRSILEEHKQCLDKIFPNLQELRFKTQFKFIRQSYDTPTSQYNTHKKVRTIIIWLYDAICIPMSGFPNLQYLHMHYNCISVDSFEDIVSRCMTIKTLKKCTFHVDSIRREPRRTIKYPQMLYPTVPVFKITIKEAHDDLLIIKHMFDTSKEIIEELLCQKKYISNEKEALVYLDSKVLVKLQKDIGNVPKHVLEYWQKKFDDIDPIYFKNMALRIFQ
jgi:hypothetical protein